MGWMSDVTIESIAKDIDKKIEIESLKILILNRQNVSYRIKDGEGNSRKSLLGGG